MQKSLEIISWSLKKLTRVSLLVVAQHGTPAVAAVPLVASVAAVLSPTPYPSLSFLLLSLRTLSAVAPTSPSLSQYVAGG